MLIWIGKEPSILLLEWKTWEAASTTSILPEHQWPVIDSHSYHTLFKLDKNLEVKQQKLGDWVTTEFFHSFKICNIIGHIHLKLTNEIQSQNSSVHNMTDYSKIKGNLSIRAKETMNMIKDTKNNIHRLLQE